MPTTYCIGNINPGEVRAEFMQSVLAVMTGGQPDEVKLVEFITKVHGPYLDVGRNFIVEKFLKTDAEVLLFIDADMEFRPPQVHEIVQRVSQERPIVGGLYVNWFADFGIRPVALDWDKTTEPPWQMLPIEMPDVADDLVPVDCVGTGFMAIHRSVFDAMSAVPEFARGATPWFAEVALFGSQMGEDVTFCQRAIALGLPVYVDPTILVRHVKTVALDPLNYLSSKPQEAAHV